jgi:general secretion pathway protein L
MTDTLYLRLEHPDASAPLEGRLVAADGSLSSAPLRGSVGELASAYPNARLVALIPAGDALSTQARLPKISAGKLRTSLPFALEEQLATDLEGQHFAMGRAREVSGTDGAIALEVPVVVIAHARLAAWLALLRAAGAEPSALHLAEDCVAPKPGDVVAWVRGEQEIFLRAPSGSAVVAGIDELPVVLDLLLGDTPRQTLGLQVHVAPEQRAVLTESFVAKLEHGATSLARVSWVAGAEDTLGWLVAQLRLAAPINLLQGEFTPRRPASEASGRWRLVAALAAIFLLLHLAGRGWTLRALEHSERQLDAQLLQAAQQQTPELRSIDPLLRTLAPSDGTLQGAALLQGALLDLVAAGLTPNSLKSIALEGKALQVELRAGVPLASIDTALSSRGWQSRASAGAEGTTILTLVRADAGATP